MNGYLSIPEEVLSFLSVLLFNFTYLHVLDERLSLLFIGSIMPFFIGSCSTFATALLDFSVLPPNFGIFPPRGTLFPEAGIL